MSHSVKCILLYVMQYVFYLMMCFADASSLPPRADAAQRIASGGAGSGVVLTIPRKLPPAHLQIPGMNVHTHTTTERERDADHEFLELSCNSSVKISHALHTPRHTHKQVVCGEVVEHNQNTHVEGVRSSPSLTSTTTHPHK